MTAQPELDPPPETGTGALLEYFWASKCDFRLFNFVIDLALRGDFVAHIARQALDGKKDNTTHNPVALAKINPGSATQTLRQSSQELLEMFISRAAHEKQDAAGSTPPQRRLRVAVAADWLARFVIYFQRAHSEGCRLWLMLEMNS